MAQGYPDTAASAFSNTLVDFAARDAAAKQQAFLNQMSQRRLAMEEQRNAALEAEHADTLAERKAESLLKKTAAEEKEADRIAADYDPSRGDIITDQRSIELMSKYHPLRVQHQPAPASTEAPPPPPGIAAGPAAGPVGTAPAPTPTPQGALGPPGIRLYPTAAQRQAQKSIEYGTAFRATLPPNKQPMYDVMTEGGTKPLTAADAKELMGEGATTAKEQPRESMGLVSINTGKPVPAAQQRPVLFDAKLGRYTLEGGAPLPEGTRAEKLPSPKDPIALELEAQRLKAGREKEESDKADADTFKQLRKDDVYLTGMANLFRKTGNIPTAGMGKDANAIKQIIQQRAFRLNPDGSYTNPETQVTTAPGADIAANKAAYEANKSALTGLTKNLASVSAFLDTADRNSKILEDTLKKIPNTPSTDLNTLLRAASTRLGSEEMAAFNTMLPSVQAEYARVIQQPNLTGVLSDTARKEVGSTLPSNATVGQIRTALKFLRAEGANRKKATQGQIDAFHDEVAQTGMPKVKEKPTADSLYESIFGKK